MSTLAATNLKHASSASNNIVLDSSGNVGIGTSSIVSPARLDLTKSTTNNDVTTQRQLRIGGDTSSTYSLFIGFGQPVTGQELGGNIQSLDNGVGSKLLLNPSGGNLLVGTSSTLFASSHAFVNSGSAVLGLRNSVSTAGKYWQVGPDGFNSFKVYNQSSVGMFMSDGSTSWSSSSDERQKNIIEPISDAVAKVVSLRAVIGSYKADEENRRRSFLIAQDVEQALPEAVTTAPDGFLGVAYTDVIPLLVAAIQEQQTQIAALEARLTALEAK
jgi:hypothetical protein